jgi:DNA-binding beta-propeller fold protein YncE
MKNSAIRVLMLLAAITSTHAIAEVLIKGDNAVLTFGPNQECEIRLGDKQLISSCEIDAPPVPPQPFDWEEAAQTPPTVTVVADGFATGRGLSGIDVSAEKTTAYASVQSSKKIWAVDIASGTKTELADSAEVAPDGIAALPDGKLLVTEDEHGPKDGGSGRIRLLDVSTGALTSNTLLAGSGRYVYKDENLPVTEGVGDAADLFWVAGVAASPDGTTAFAMAYGTRQIMKIDIETRMTTVLAGEAIPYGSNSNYPEKFANGIGTEAKFDFVHVGGIQVTPDGKTVLVADEGNYKIRAIDIESQAVSTLVECIAPILECTDIAITPEGSTLFVMGGSGLYAVDMSTLTATTLYQLQDAEKYTQYAQGNHMVALDEKTLLVAGKTEIFKMEW